MKKVIVIILAIVLAGVVLYSSGLFQEIGSMLNERFELRPSNPEVFYIQEDGIIKEENSAFVLSEKDRLFFRLDYIRQGAVTMNHFVFEDETHIQTLQNLIIIDGKGAVTVGGKPVSGTVEIRSFLDVKYISLTDILKIPELESLGVAAHTSEDKSILYVNKRIKTNICRAQPETKIFASIEDAQQAQKPSKKTFSFRDKKPYAADVSAAGFYFSSGIGAQALSDQKDSDNKNEDHKESAKAKGAEDLIFFISSKGEYGFGKRSDFTEFNEKEAFADTANFPAKYEEKISLVWEPVYSHNPDTAAIPDMPGLNVVSPMWYTLEGTDGTFSDKSGEEYIKWAKGKNYQIWPAIVMHKIEQNHSFLSSYSGQRTAIKYMVDQAVKHGFEGINVDIEHVYLADKHALSHFVNMLGHEMRKWDLILSVDVNVTGGSDNWSRFYDHAVLGKIADYIIVMTYDQHGSSSQIAGPVAAYTWVDYHMGIIVDLVEPHKLVLGVPFYTRLWEEKQSPNNPGATIVTSKALPMTDQEKVLKNRNFEITWDEKTMTNVAKSYTDDVTYTMWLENPESLELKMGLIEKYNLAGVAAWCRGYEIPEVWEALRHKD